MDAVSSARPERPRVTPAADLVTWLQGEVPVRTVGDLTAEVTGVSLSTARVRPGDLFAALSGARAHGASYAEQALAAGAVAVLTDEQGVALLPAGTPAFVVADPRGVLGRLAAHIHGNPARDLQMIGITGTQGKTTSARLLERALTSAGVPTGVVGTIGTSILGEVVPTSLTTPEAPDLQGLFALMRERHAQVCVMEVSSHALVLGRVDGVVFDVGVFLNLGRDHLDFHSDVDDYFAAKASLFTPERSVRGLTNIDDEHGRLLLERASVPMQTMSTTGRDADWQAIDVELSAGGATFTVLGPGVRERARLEVPGAFNVANALAGIAAAASVGIDAATVVEGLGSVGGVPGRLERVDEGQDFTVVVDYAHKPEALTAVLETLRPVTKGRLIAVIGAGGDRDPGKRPIMGRIAAELADLVIVTDDNPRTEDPATIRGAVLAGCREGRAEVLDVGDRRLAIRTALERAHPGDVVLIAGKGHETGQEVHGEVHPFDDRVVAAEELRAR